MTSHRRRYRTLKVGDEVRAHGESSPAGTRLTSTGREAARSCPRRSEGRRHLPLRPGGDAGRRRQVGRRRRRPDHQHPRGALPGRRDRAVGVRGVIGKGGMGPKTLAACQKHRRGLPARRGRRSPLSSPRRSRRARTSTCSKSSASPRRSGSSRSRISRPWSRWTRRHEPPREGLRSDQENRDDSSACM